MKRYSQPKKQLSARAGRENKSSEKQKQKTLHWHEKTRDNKEHKGISRRAPYQVAASQAAIFDRVIDVIFFVMFYKLRWRDAASFFSTFF